MDQSVAAMTYDMDSRQSFGRRPPRGADKCQGPDRHAQPDDLLSLSLYLTTAGHQGSWDSAVPFLQLDLAFKMRDKSQVAMHMLHLGGHRDLGLG